MILRYVLTLGGSAIVLSDAALKTMNHYRQIAPRSKEAGGQLFARFERDDTIIVEATPPKWWDRRNRYNFHPNRWLQQQEIRNRYVCGLHYVGDWHTHPQAVPQPSQEDYRNMQECFNDSIHDLNRFIMIIVGYVEAPEGLHVTLIGQNTVQLMFCENSL